MKRFSTSELLAKTAAKLSPPVSVLDSQVFNVDDIKSCRMIESKEDEEDAEEISPTQEGKPPPPCIHAHGHERDVKALFGLSDTVRTSISAPDLSGVHRQVSKGFSPGIRQHLCPCSSEHDLITWLSNTTPFRTWTLEGFQKLSITGAEERLAVR